MEERVKPLLHVIWLDRVDPDPDQDLQFFAFRFVRVISDQEMTSVDPYQTARM
jgi:hypothetical protein